ncbi:hypothetical protein C9374_013649 [Naegleria lovaniensis]|uniref:Protein kinase domain-containing protein n=1 Tax=Naegleria lovaniensis TaxID=51637 RepID=A0AA88KD78_NAELO|nr:uncharacterized protein C9374_013649 [Naegleria lovaniensis]KAG2372694.1 hypothetical protein C9374_013649 [Naegleria lovaniensis]
MENRWQNMYSSGQPQERDYSSHSTYNTSHAFNNQPGLNHTASHSTYNNSRRVSSNNLSDQGFPPTIGSSNSSNYIHSNPQTMIYNRHREPSTITRMSNIDHTNNPHDPLIVHGYQGQEEMNTSPSRSPQNSYRNTMDNGQPPKVAVVANTVRQHISANQASNNHVGNPRRNDSNGSLPSIPSQFYRGGNSQRNEQDIIESYLEYLTTKYKTPDNIVRLEYMDKGAFGKVFKVRIEQPGEEPLEFAVKMIQKNSGNNYVKEKIPLQLNHDNIITIYDVFETRIGNDEVLGLKMKLYLGTLNDRYGTDRNMPQIIAVQVLCQMGNAICIVHQHSLLHHDISGNNVLIEEFDARSQQIKVVLADFSLCREVDSVREGTVETMAPEVDKPYVNDIYSLGQMISNLTVNSHLSRPMREYLSLMTSNDVLKRPSAETIEQDVTERVLSPGPDLQIVESFYKTLRAERLEEGLNNLKKEMKQRATEINEQRTAVVKEREIAGQTLVTIAKFLFAVPATLLFTVPEYYLIVILILMLVGWNYWRLFKQQNQILKELEKVKLEQNVSENSKISFILRDLDKAVGDYVHSIRSQTDASPRNQFERFWFVME